MILLVGKKDFRMLAKMMLITILFLFASVSGALEPVVRLIPQEIYGDQVLDLLGRRGQDGILIMQFTFFTDNRENSYPKRIAQKLVEIQGNHTESWQKNLK